MSQFQAAEKDGMHMIVSPKMIDPKIGKDLEVMIKGWLVVAANIHVLDFKELLSLDPTAYRPFVLFHQALKANNKHLFTLNASHSIQAQLKQAGLTTVFNFAKTLEEVKRKARSPHERPVIDVELINPFITAAKAVLETQANTPLTPGKPYLRKAGENLPVEVAGILSLNCSEFKGSIVLCFPGKVFLGIYANMVGEQHTEINSEIEDAAGELLNIIFGQAKTVLNDQKGYNLDKSLPTVLAGEKLKVHHQSRLPAIVLPFETPVGGFHIEILVEPS